MPLSHDHREALGLAFRLNRPAPPGPVTPTTPASTPASRTRETLAFFVRSLEPHFRAEEQVLFPAVRGQPGATGEVAALLDALEADHQRFEELRRALARTQDENELVPLLAEFGTLLEQHVRREERELFARFPTLVDGEADALRIGEAIRATLGRT